SALLSPDKEVSPRNINSFDPNGPPFDLVIFRPATLPTNASDQLLDIASVSCSPETVLTEYPKAFCSLLIPNAVTTTSSTSCAVEAKRTVISQPAVTPCV